MRHHGVVDKFIGDALMAVFCAPSPHPEDPLRAVQTALDMRQRLAELNNEFQRRGPPRIQVGIGIHNGDSTVAEHLRFRRGPESRHSLIHRGRQRSKLFLYVTLGRHCRGRSSPRAGVDPESCRVISAQAPCV